MRITGVAAAIVVFAVAVAGAGRAPEQAKGAPADAIKAVADAYVKAALAGDAKAIAALYTDDAIEMPPNQPMVKGKAAIEQFYVKEFGSGGKMNTFTIAHIDTQVSGDQGYDVGTYQQSFTPKGAPSPLSDSGKYTVIAKRVGGAWKVAYAIYNSNQPPPKQ
ncbi:MAG TPA: SgcJ/EcaC family oxidoreductase [Vicinamibacterales bacterium]|jgi:uncharacterized protein (TIGR02246 family)